MPAPFDSDTIVLIIEPNASLETPYKFLNGIWDVRRVNSIEEALLEVEVKPPELVLLSASFAPKHSLRLLEMLREVSVFRIIPLLVVVDLSFRISAVLGLSWGDKIAVIDTAIPKKDFFSILQRITTA